MKEMSRQGRARMFNGEPLMGWKDVMRKLRPKIQRALDYGENTYSFDNLVMAVERGRLKLFYSSDAVLFAEMTCYPQYKTLDYVLAAGSIKGLAPLEACARAWGKAMSCSKVRAGGRPGWAKIAKQRGWTQRREARFFRELNDAI
jgi:hypothetical protein